MVCLEKNIISVLLLLIGAEVRNFFSLKAEEDQENLLKLAEEFQEIKRFFATDDKRQRRKKNKVVRLK